MEANLEIDREELARVAKEAEEVEAALATAIREADVVLADKAVNDKRIEVRHTERSWGDWRFHIDTLPHGAGRRSDQKCLLRDNARHVEM